MRCPEENSTLRQERQDAPALRGHPFHHHIIPSPTLLSYCPRRYSHHWTQLSRASAPRLYNSLSHPTSVTRLASKGLGVDFFFFFTLCAEPCVCFFVSWLQLLSKVRVHEDRQGFLYRTLVFVVLFFFVSYQIWEGRDSGREGERGGYA